MAANDKKPVSLASMAEELRQLRKKVETRNAGEDDASKKQKERMDAIKKRISEDVRNQENAGGRRMPSSQQQQQTQSSAQQSDKKSPAATTKVEQASFKEDSTDWKQTPGTERIKGSGRVQKGISANRFNKYVGKGREHSYENYMSEDEKKKKGESNVVGS
jgi:hypothetical protein